MSTERYSAHALVNLLRANKIATMPELMSALGTDVQRTVFRKLALLPYRASYSHKGRYYTLDDIAEFDEFGLWSFRAVWFSVFGNLLSTAQSWVEGADAGYFVNELDNALHVGTNDALRNLARDGRLVREKIGRQYLYCSADRETSGRQLLMRRADLATPGPSGPLPAPDIMPDELKAAIVLFFSLLDEKQRRLYAGLESLKTGYGGDSRIAELFGLAVGTVARGRKELLDQDIATERIRRAGAGRPSVEKKRRK